jgi:hypothetical protein
MAEIQRKVVEWSNIVRNRPRWISRTDSVDTQVREATAFVKLLGMTDEHLEKLGTAARVEIVLPNDDADWAHAARALPWEFVLTSATKAFRRAPMTITRQLISRRRLKAPQLSGSRSLLYVECAPGKLGEEFDFTAERVLVESSVRPGEFQWLHNPTRELLKSTIADFAPDVVHIAGFDSHQGLALLDDSSAISTEDGILLAGTSSAVDPVPAQELARLLTCGKVPPALVVFNVWNSASRLAPGVVARGAGAAMGFQDFFDDALAELFFGAFYQALTLSSNDIELALAKALEVVRAQPKSVRGTGVAFWSATPLVERTNARATARRTSEFRTQFAAEESRVIRCEDVPDEQIPQLFSLTIKPVTSINYSLLHNDRDLFQEFVIRKLQPGRVDGLFVGVELNVGSGTYPYRRSFSMSDPLLDLSRLVRIALTSDLARSVDEVLRTSLFVEVIWGLGQRERIIFRETMSVTLAPVDQWTDTMQDRLWLPSFVFPRDPAIQEIVSAAQRYVTALRDDPTAGFDGYQSVDENADDPSAHVDSQVHALWYAIMHEVGLGYINPPPTYAVASQRLRPPCEVVKGHRGTCIDLALLLAACLEYIEVYPVIFLLEDHAFPGYWRSEAVRNDFLDRVMAQGEDSESGGTDRAVATRRLGEPWYFDKGVFREIKAAVANRHLVPIETVGLTARDGFAASIDAASTYFTRRNGFDAMLDVRQARDFNVTPIPLRAAAR